MSNPTTLPTIEAVIRSPLGEVRVWIDPEGAVRTSLNAELGRSPASEGARAQVLAVIDQAARSVRAVLGCEATSAAAGSNAFADWLDARVEREPGSRINSSALFEDYLAWCERANARPISMRAFGEALGERQFLVVGKDRIGRILRGGLKLRAAAGEETAGLRVVV